MFQEDPNKTQNGKEIFPFEMGYLPEFFRKKAEVELNDTPENRQKGLKVFKRLIANDKNMSCLTFDDDFLLQYLRCRKFNVNKAFSQLKAYANLRKNYKNLFKNFRFENSAISTKDKVFTYLPYRCQDGCAIMLIKLGNWMPETFPPEEVKRTVVICLLQALREPMTQVNGFKVIFDLNSDLVRHLRHITPGNMYLMYHGTQECSPGRFKSIHIVHKSLTMKAAWAIVKVFLTPKIRRRVHFHDKPEELLDYFPAAVLPVEYGGELKDFDMTDWLRDIMSLEKIATLGGGISLDSY